MKRKRRAPKKRLIKAAKVQRRIILCPLRIPSRTIIVGVRFVDD